MDGGNQAPSSASRALLRTHATQIQRLARENHLRNVQVFGSVARGDDGPESDIDLLVDPEPRASYFDFARFAIDVEELLGRQVDIVSRRALDPVRDAAILRDAVDLHHSALEIPS